MEKPAITLDPLELERHRPQLLKFAMVQLRNATHAEDVVQETLIAALQGIDRFQGSSSVRTWLTGILKHKIIDHFRRQSRETPLEGLEEEFSVDDFDDLYTKNGHLASATPRAELGRSRSHAVAGALLRGAGSLHGGAAEEHRPGVPHARGPGDGDRRDL